MTQMMDFDTDLDRQGVRSIVIDKTVPAPETRTVVTPSTERSHLVGGDWGWEQVRDYAITEIEARFGPFPRNSFKENATFKAFCERWGDKAAAIARSAFESHDGYWMGSPISVTRFCKGSDPYFAAVLAERLAS